MSRQYLLPLLLLVATCLNDVHGDCSVNQLKLMTQCENFIRNDFKCPDVDEGDLCARVMAKIGTRQAKKAVQFDLSKDVHIRSICFSAFKSEISSSCLYQKTTTPSYASKLRCVFFHGMGRKGPVPDDLQRSSNLKYRAKLKRYWGNTNEVLSDICDSMFYFTDTYNRGWDDPVLQNEYCDVIEAYRPHLVFTHSMGNNILAAGIARQRSGCNRVVKQFDKTQQKLVDLVPKISTLSKTQQNTARVDAQYVYWFGMQGPLAGSPGGQHLVEICPNKRLWNNLGDFVLAKRYCDKDHEARAPLKSISPIFNNINTYDNPKYTGMTGREKRKIVLQQNCDLDKNPSGYRCISLPNIATEYMKGSMCGTSPTGTHLVSSGGGLGLFNKLFPVVDFGVDDAPEDEDSASSSSASASLASSSSLSPSSSSDTPKDILRELVRAHSLHFGIDNDDTETTKGDEFKEYHGNDAMVPFTSCSLKRQWTAVTASISGCKTAQQLDVCRSNFGYERSPSNFLYATQMNHADARGTANDVADEPSRQPKAWMKNAIHWVRCQYFPTDCNNIFLATNKKSVENGQRDDI